MSKDRLENRLKRLVCAHALRLSVAQRAIAVNWVSAYRRYVSGKSAHSRRRDTGRAMSQENVERIRRGHEVLHRGEWSAASSEAIHAMVTESFHPDIEWHDQRELPGSTAHHGIEEVERHLAATREAWDYYRADLLEIIDAGPSVVAVYQIHARGRTSGATVERDAVWVYTFRGEKVERVEIFGTRNEALEAVGMRE